MNARGPTIANGANTADIEDRVAVLKRALVPLNQVEFDPSRSYLAKGWLNRSGLSVLFGESNVGKTFLALDMALHIAAGQPWHGVRVAEACSVIYIAAEGGRGVMDRLNAVWKDKPDLARAVGENFALLPVTVDLCGPTDALAILRMMREMGTKPGLIVVDTLARSLGSGDENAGPDMGAFIANVDKLRIRSGAHVLVVHHAGKDTARGARGHSSLRGAVDTEIELTRSDKVITAETKKQRDMEGGKTFSYTLRSVYLGNDDDGEAVSSCVVEPTEDQAAPKRKRLSPSQERALETFLMAKQRAGLADDLSASVDEGDWREVFYEMSTSDNQEAKKVAFQRARKALVEVTHDLAVTNGAYRLARVPQ